MDAKMIRRKLWEMGNLQSAKASPQQLFMSCKKNILFKTIYDFYEIIKLSIANHWQSDICILI